jgi:hypothetical protein
MRLDQLIVAKHLVTEEQLREALDYQKAYGGRLESHLYRFGYIDESSLVTCLSEQFGYAGVVLSGREIPDEVIRMVPAGLAWAQLVLPFEYDPIERRLKLACENPSRDGLREQLAAANPDVAVKLYVALGAVLQSALVRYYRQPHFSPEPVDESALSGTEKIDLRRLRGLAERPLDSGKVRQVERLSADEKADPDYSSRTRAKVRCKILLLADSRSSGRVLEQALSHQGFTVIKTRTVDQFATELAESEPDALLLVAPAGRKAVVELVSELSIRNLSVSDWPSYLVIPSSSDTDVGELLRVGFEEVIPSENVLDLLMIKLGRLRERLAARQSQRLEIIKTLGTHGSLEDMNVIDLLQAMGPTGKTARISVSGAGQQLTVFLERGRIVYAECDETRGAEAVYCALGWKHGVWSVDPVPPETLPEPNNYLTNEALLLEGCRRLDEMGGRPSRKAEESGDPLAFMDNLS